MKVNGKVFVVTGAGSGMGRELTLELIRRGAQVAAVDIRADALAETKSLAGENVETFPLDVTDPAAVAALPDRVLQHFVSIDGLINNAGIIQPFVKIAELSLNDANRVVAVNFTGPLMLIKAFLPILVSRPEAHIVNVSSMGAYAPVPGQSVYGASKAAIAQLSDGLRSELQRTHIGVTTVYPGAINTNIAANSGINVPATSASKMAIKTTDAKVAAKQMVAGIESERDQIFIGADSKSLKMLSRINPKLAAWLIYRNMRELLGE